MNFLRWLSSFATIAVIAVSLQFGGVANRFRMNVWNIRLTQSVTSVALIGNEIKVDTSDAISCSDDLSYLSSTVGGYIAGRVALICGDLDRAIAILQRIRPLTPLGAYWLGDTYYRTHQHSLALSTWKHYGLSKSLIAEGKNRLQVNNYFEALQVLQAAVEVEPDSESLSELGEAQYRIGRTNDAEDVFLRALEFPGSHALTYSRLGDISAAKQDWLDSYSYYRAALQENPKTASARIGLIVSEYHIDGDKPGALARLSSAASEFPDYMWGYLTLARLYSDSYQYGDADRWFALADKRFPGESAVSSWWGFSKSARGDYAGAVQLFSKTSLQKPDDAQPYIWLAQSLYKNGDCGAALQQLAIAMQLSTQDAGMLESAGDVYVEMGRPGEARAAYEAILRLDPTRKQVQDKLGSIAQIGEGNCK